MRERVEANLDKRRNKEIKDTKGGAGSKLAKAIGANAGSLNSALREMEAEGRVFRDIVGRRTFAIRLTDPPSEPTPAASTNGAVAGPRTDFMAKLNEAMAVGEALVGKLIEENEQLRKQLAKSEQKVGELQLEVAAMKREVKDTRNSAQLISEIEQKLAALKGG